MSATFTFTDTVSQDVEIRENVNSSGEVLSDLMEYPNWLKVRVSDKSPVGNIDATDASNLSYLDDLEFDSGEVPAFQLGVEGAETPFFGIDYDDVAENREFISPETASVVMDAPAGYMEWSISGSGCHRVGRGELLDDFKCVTNTPFGSHGGDAHIEVYSRKRYFVLTGDTLMESTPNPRQNIDYWHDFQREHLQKTVNTESQFAGAESTQTAGSRKVRYTIEQYSKGSGGLSGLAQDTLDWMDSSPDRSPAGNGHEGDMSLVNYLRFWCKGDKMLMLECWQSARRWDEKCEELPACYVQVTLDKALNSAKHTDVFQSEYLTPVNRGGSE